MLAKLAPVQTCETIFKTTFLWYVSATHLTLPLWNSFLTVCFKTLYHVYCTVLSKRLSQERLVYPVCSIWLGFIINKYVIQRSSNKAPCIRYTALNTRKPTTQLNSRSPSRLLPLSFVTTSVLQTNCSLLLLNVSWSLSVVAPLAFSSPVVVTSCHFIQTVVSWMISLCNWLLGFLFFFFWFFCTLFCLNRKSRPRRAVSSTWRRSS